MSKVNKEQKVSEWKNDGKGNMNEKESLSLLAHILAVYAKK